MVRTKDLILIVLALVMLGTAISATVAPRFFGTADAPVSFGEESPSLPEYEAFVPHTEEEKRQANIERLRAALAQGDVIESSPSVEAPEPVVSENEGETPLGCVTPYSGIDTARSWPLDGVSIRTAGANRLVVHATAPAALPQAATSTTIAAPASETILISLPLFPQKQSDPTCLDTEIIGVTADGSLIFNTDAVLYRGTSSETLIGYARDGFPIYGAYAGTLDQCGGYEGPTGYRYAVSAQNNVFLSCFSGSPQSFSR